MEEGEEGEHRDRRRFLMFRLGFFLEHIDFCASSGGVSGRGSRRLRVGMQRGPRNN